MSRSVVTIVSCFYPIKKSKHGIGEYYKWMFHFLTNATKPIIMFGEKESINIMQEMRKIVGKNDGILFIEKPFIQCEFSTPEWIEKWNRQVPLSDHKDLHCQELFRVWANKSFFVQEAIERNPFGSEYFMWCDSGCWRDFFAAQICCPEWPLVEKIVPNKMQFLTINSAKPMLEQLASRSHWTQRELIREIRTSNKNCLSGSMFCGSVTAWKEWIPAYKRTLELFLEEDFFAGDDQHVMLSAALWLRHTLPEDQKPAFFAAPPHAPFIKIGENTIGNVWFAFHEHFSRIPFKLEMY